MPIGDDVLEIKGNTASAVTALEALDAQLEKLNQTSQGISAELIRGFNAANGAVKGTTVSVGVLATAVAAATAGINLALAGVKAAYEATVGIFVDVVTAGAQAETIARKLDTAWANAANRIGLTRAELDALAESLGKANAIDDDVLKNLEARLLTFDKIGRDNFLRVLPIVLNTAANSGQSLETVMTSLGRALQDPAHNVSAIANNVISLSNETKTLAKELALAGDVIGAQNAILAELEARTQGAAEAAATTFAAAQSRASIAVNELYEKIAISLMPAFIEFVNGIATAIDAIGPFVPMLVEAAQGFVSNALGASDFTAAMKDLPTIMANVAVGVADVAKALLTMGLRWELVKLQAAHFFMTIEDYLVSLEDITESRLARFFAGWENTFTNIGNFATTVFSNIWLNFGKFWADLLSKITGGGGEEFTWTPITEGYEKAIAKLPAITEAKMSEAHVQVALGIAKISQELDRSWVDVGNKAKGGPGTPLPVPAPGSTVVPPMPPKKRSREDEAAARKDEKQVWKDMAADFKFAMRPFAEFGAMAKKGFDTPWKKAEREAEEKKRKDLLPKKGADKGFQSEAIDLLSLHSRIQSAALSAGKDQEKAAIIETEKHAKETKELNKKLYDLFTKAPGESAKRLADAISPTLGTALRAAGIAAEAIPVVVRTLNHMKGRAG